MSRYYEIVGDFLIVVVFVCITGILAYQLDKTQGELKDLTEKVSVIEEWVDGGRP